MRSLLTHSLALAAAAAALLSSAATPASASAIGVASPAESATPPSPSPASHGVWGIGGPASPAPSALAWVDAATGVMTRVKGGSAVPCGWVVQQGSALDGRRRVLYNLALNCTDPATGKRDPRRAGDYWLVGLSLADGGVVAAQRVPHLLPFDASAPFATPGEGVTVASDPSSGDVYVLGPVATVPLPPTPAPGPPTVGPLMLLQRFERAGGESGGDGGDDGGGGATGGDDKKNNAASVVNGDTPAALDSGSASGTDTGSTATSGPAPDRPLRPMRVTNVSSALSASTVVGVDAAFGNGVFYSFFTPVNTTGFSLVSVDATRRDAPWKDLGSAPFGTIDFDAVTGRLFGLGESATGQRTLVSADPSTGAARTVATVAGFNVVWGSDAALDANRRTHYSLLCPSGGGGGGGCASSDFHLVQVDLETGAVVAHPAECAAPDGCTVSMEVEQWV